MKNFNRTSFPHEGINHSGKHYTTQLNSADTAGLTAAELKTKGYNVIQVTVLSRNLKGKTDLHGKPYEGSKFLFICKK